jgi:hypothetical protein
MGVALKRRQRLRFYGMFDLDSRKDFELTIAAHAYRVKTFKIGVYPPGILPSKDSLPFDPKSAC